MGLCSGRTCGCALTSSDLSISGSGTTVDPWNIGYPVSGSLLPMRVFADAATRDAALPSPTEGQEVWLSTPDTKHRYIGGAWRTIYQGNTVFNPTFTNFTVGGSNVTARYHRLGDDVIYNCRVILQAGAAVPGGVIQLNLPVAPRSGAGTERITGPAGFYDSGSSQIWVGLAHLEPSTVALFNPNPSGFSQGAGAPFVWTIGDEFWFTLVYPAA